MKVMIIFLSILFATFQVANAGCKLCCSIDSKYVSEQLENVPACHRSLVLNQAQGPAIKTKFCTVMDYDSLSSHSEIENDIPMATQVAVLIRNLEIHVVGTQSVAHYDFRKKQRFRDKIRLHQIQEKFLN